MTRAREGQEHENSAHESAVRTVYQADQQFVCHAIGIGAARAPIHPFVATNPNGRSNRQTQVMGDLTAHFSRWEFDCPHCGALPTISLELVTVLERIRNHLGRPLVVVSGFRCSVYNRRVGGWSKSEHLYGRAADIPRGLVRPALAKSAGAHGAGVRDGWVIHVDVTPGRQFFTFNE